MLSSRTALICFLVLCLGSVGHLPATGGPTPNAHAEALPVPDSHRVQAAELLANKTGPLARIGDQLSILYQDYSDFLQNRIGEPFSTDNPLLTLLPGDRVVVDAVAIGNAEDLLTEMQALGLERFATYGRMVSGSLPIDQLDELATCNALRLARPAASGSRTGLAQTLGDQAMGSDLVRQAFGLDGSGVTVGVVSNSYDCLGGASADMASGDLPSQVQVLDDSFCPDIDEARAMLQIVHDIAPGASLAMHSSSGGEANMASAIEELASQAGAQVIVDDVIYFAEPMFQDGIIAQAVDAVAGNGVAYFSAAGNENRKSYEGAFEDSGVAGLIGPARHDFDAGPGMDDLLDLTLGTGLTVFALQWTEPFFSVSGGAGAQSDLDVFLYTQSGVFTGFGSATTNAGGDAVEFFGISNPGPPIPVRLGVELFAGEAPEFFKLVVLGDGTTTIDEHSTQSSTVYGHANARGAVAVGSGSWFNTPLFNPNLSLPSINSASSAGGTPICFDLDGDPIFDLRRKPQVVAPDGGNTTFFGLELPFSVTNTGEPDGLPNFFGTSASAPHVAAVAALMLQANPYLWPSQVAYLLEGTATDMDDPFTADFDYGFDFGTGYGYVDALAAVEASVTCRRRKIFICHKPQTRNRTKCVSRNAVAAHLAHGDTFGPCRY